jgi:endonuclease G, mitochondrial
MNRKVTRELPGAENRIASVLKSKEMRDALAKRASNHELTSRRELEYSADVIADHLSKSRAPEADVSFFGTRHMSEAIILRIGRPVLFVREGVIEQADLKEVESRLKKVRKALVTPISAVGRIELSDHDTFEWCGTGWRVDEDLVVTNRHVAAVFAQRQGRKFKYRLNQAGKGVRARIDFREEFKGTDSEEFGIAEILWISDDTDAAPDMAVLRVQKNGWLPPPLSLADKNAGAGQQIGVVGYPAKDSRNDVGVMADVFHDIYDVKRFAPGEVVKPGDDTWYLTHDASTLGGSSGSAVIDLDSQKVVGLHFGGSFRKTNYAVKTSVIKSVLARRSWVAVSHESLNIPTEAFKEMKRTAASMKNREGYDANFLGRKAAPPTPGKSHPVLKTKFPGSALPYTHFSILMSGSRRLPIFTAENLNGALKIQLKRKDSWGFDPRIPQGAQVGHKEFYGPELFDKGHMVRRENPGWGETEEEAQLGEEDSYVYTNAVPQMPQLNQRTWLSLENYVLNNAKTEGFKVCVFTGPVFQDGDPTYSGVQVPTDFWKVVVAIDADTGGLLTSAYLLSQDGLMPKEGFRYGAFKTYQAPIKRIEELADLKFSKSVRDADVFGMDEVEEMVETARYIEITSEDDIVLTKARK